MGDAGGFDWRGSHLYADEPLPAWTEADALIVMDDGSMGVHDDALYP